MVLFKLFKNLRQGRSKLLLSNSEYSHVLVFGFEALSTKSLNSLYVAVFFIMVSSELFKLKRGFKMSTILKDEIIRLINNLAQPNKIFVLKGFNRYLDEINQDFLFERRDILSEKASLTPEVIKALLSANKASFIIFEDLAALADQQMVGTFNAIGKEVVILDNDFYELYYPGPADPEISQRIKADYESEQDNLTQLFYGDVQENGDNACMAFNSFELPKYEYINISDLLKRDGVTVTGDQDLEIPEEYTSAVFSSIITEIIEKPVSNLNVLASASGIDPNIEHLKSKLEPLGISFYYRKYQTPESITSTDLLPSDLDILHRKNPNYDFRTLKIYKNPYESNELTDISQVQIIDDIVQNAIRAKDSQTFRDVFVTAPTGAGKSVMFQIPAIYLAEQFNLVTIVVSPLIGLMNDQVQNIQSMTDKAATINSDYTPYQKEEILEQVKKGEKSILYLSPESLLSNTDISGLIGDRQIGLVVVDEAHIVATWGKSFRPDYWYLGDFINSLRNSARVSYTFPIVTFTATATFNSDDDMYRDIIESLKMTPNKYIGNVRRSDISFDIRCKDKETSDYKSEKLEVAVNSINELMKTNDKVLVYTPYTKHIDELYENINNPEKVGKYYGGLSAAEKKDTLKQIGGGTKNVVLATKAFGMGIDIDDIRYVYHFAPTGNITDYVQEIGRVARKPDMTGVAVTDYYKEDFRYINQLYGMSSIKNYQVIGVLRKIFELYSHYRKRNFLVSPEEFSYIFAELKLEDIDSRLKTTLLMIKKDFEASSRSNYPPLIFKPRSMFTNGYFMVNDDFVAELQQKGLMRYFTKLNLPLIVKQAGTRRFDPEITVRSPGYTYKLDFKALWEHRYRDMSFGMFKRCFMENKLDFNFKVGEKLIQRVVIDINSPTNLVAAKMKLFDFLDTIQEIFDDLHQENKHFGIDDLAARIIEKNCVKKKYQAEAVAGSIIKLLERVELHNVSGALSYGFANFYANTGKYYIKNTTYETRIKRLRGAANVFLSNPESNHTVRYASNTASTDIIVAQLLELLEMADCKVMAGTNPEFFIRINDPSAIKKIIDSPNYVSKTVSVVGKKHKESCDLMSYFFSVLKDDLSRWDFIEKYFLGQLEPLNVPK